MVRLLGSRRLGVGGLTARATSTLGEAFGRREAVQSPHGDHRAGRRHRRQRRGFRVGVAAAQRHQEVADVGLGDLGQVVDAPRGQVLGVAAQIAAIRTQGVGGDATLDGQVVEVALELVIEGRAGRTMSHSREVRHLPPGRRTLVGLSIHGGVDHGASTGRSVAVADGVGGQNPAHRNGIDDLAAQHHPHGLVERKPPHRQVGLLVVGVGPARRRSGRSRGRPARSRR